MNPQPPQNQAPHPNGNPQPPEVRVIYDEAPLNNLIDAVKNQTADQESQNKDLIRAIEKNKPIEPNDRHPRNANIIAICAAFFSFMAGLATVVVMIYTIRSVNVARDALADNRKKDSSQRISDSLNAIKQDSIFHVRFKLDSSAMSDQIKVLNGTLTETRREFEIENRPYIEIMLDSVMVTQFEYGKPIAIKYSIANLRDITTKIIGIRTIIMVDSNDVDFNAIKPDIDSLLKRDKIGNFNMFLTRQTQIGGHGSIPFALEDSIMYKLKKAIYRLYILGGVKFENMINHRIYHYYFEVKLTATRTGGYAVFLKNFNTN